MGMSSVIVVAGGSGVRMGGGTKKEFAFLDGRPVLYHAVKPFIDTALFASVVVVINNALMHKADELLAPFLSRDEAKMISFVSGGSSRRESVLNGLIALKELSPDIVLIHDGARPWITKDVIQEVYEKVEEKGAAIPVVPSVNALKKIDPSGKVAGSIDRAFAAGAQTPQGFLFQAILSAHLSAAVSGKDYADDAEVYSEFAGDVYTVPGDVKNIKITYREDLGEQR